MRRNSQNIPARCVNGVKLSDEEIANITWRFLFGKPQQLRNQLRMHYPMKLW